MDKNILRVKPLLLTWPRDEKMDPIYINFVKIFKSYYVCTILKILDYTILLTLEVIVNDRRQTRLRDDVEVKVKEDNLICSLNVRPWYEHSKKCGNKTA